MEAPYRKDLSHTTWDEVFARQAKRVDLIMEWMADLDLKPGARVLDVGAGPGYVSLVLAQRVGPEGIVYAVDRSAEALAYLERLQRERGIGQIQRIVADAATMPPGTLRPDSALVTMVLHHTDDPSGLLANVARLTGDREDDGRIPAAGDAMEKHALPKLRAATPPPGSPGEYSRGGGLPLAMLRERETLVIGVEIPGRGTLESSI